MSLPQPDGYLAMPLDANAIQAKAEIADAASFVRERSGHGDKGLAVIGFSLGAHYALELAAADPEHVRSVVSVTLPTTTSTSPKPASTGWRKRCGVPAAK
jgi:pimeloyl-ACP methyl ester carboxylesterase